MFKFALIELIDRFCIAKIKFELLGSNKEELDFYSEQLKLLDISKIETELNELEMVHRKIWDMEDEFKKGVVDYKYPLEEIGRRAILIRNLGEERYKLKNKIADLLNDPIKERKNYGNSFLL